MSKRSTTTGSKTRRAYPVSRRDKYSIETTFVHQELGAGGAANDHAALVVVKSIDFQGMRKVKHLEFTITGEANHYVLWALVYAPQTTVANPEYVLQTAVNGGSLYEPNQYVIMSGVTNFNAGALRYKSPLARNLNSGDKILLLVKNQTAQTTTIQGTVRYAVTLQ